MDQTSATRMTLLARRSQLALAEQGGSLLRSKRDALVKELSRMLPPLAQKYRVLYRVQDRASWSLAFARALDGATYVAGAGLRAGAGRRLALREAVSWGVRKLEPSPAAAPAAPPAVAGVTGRTATAANDAAAVVEALVRLVPEEVTARRLADDIRQASRRLNALDQVLIPRLRQDIRVITQVLEEMEREDAFRLRRIKGKRERAARAARAAKSAQAGKQEVHA